MDQCRIVQGSGRSSLRISKLVGRLVSAFHSLSSVIQGEEILGTKSSASIDLQLFVVVHQRRATGIERNSTMKEVRLPLLIV